MNATAVARCAIDSECKENIDNQNQCVSKKHASPGRVHGAPLRLIDANKLVFAPSPAKSKKAIVLVKSEPTSVPIIKSTKLQSDDNLDSCSTLELVDMVRNKMDMLKLKAEQKVSESAKKNETESSEIKRLTEQVEALKKQQKEADSKKRNVEHIEAVNLRRQIKVLEEELSRSRQSQSPKVKANRLEMDLNLTRQQLCDQRDFFEKRLQQVQVKHEKEVEILTAKLHESRRKLAKIQNEYQQQQDYIHSFNLKYTETVQNYERHVAHLESRLSKTMSVNTTKSAINQDLQRFEREKAALKDALRRATNELESFESIKEECDELRETVQAHKHTISQLNTQLEAMRQPYAKAKHAADYYEQSMGVIQQRLQRLGEENRYLRSLLPPQNQFHKS